MLVFWLSVKSVLSANSSYFAAPNTAPPPNVIAVELAPNPPDAAIAAVVGKLSAICSPNNLAASKYLPSFARFVTEPFAPMYLSSKEAN